MASEKIWTVGSILKWTEQYFRERGIESSRLDAEVLLSHVLNKERIYLYVHFDEPLEASELAAYKAAIKRRVLHEPVAYITGKKEFMGLPFKVSNKVLIPRPDTEILVQSVLEHLPEDKVRIADIGTGSGAIVLSLLAYRNNIFADTVDISAEALAVAKENAEDFGVSDRVVFLEGDLFEPLKESYVAIVSNPPYIPKADMLTLAADVKDYEPEAALFGGEDGLDYYRRLASNVRSYLDNGGFIAVEVGIGEAGAVKDLFTAAGLVRPEIIRDYAGIERVVLAWKE